MIIVNLFAEEGDHRCILFAEHEQIGNSPAILIGRFENEWPEALNIVRGEIDEWGVDDVIEKMKEWGWLITNDKYDVLEVEY